MKLPKDLLAKISVIKNTGQVRIPTAQKISIEYLYIYIYLEEYNIRNKTHSSDLFIPLVLCCCAGVGADGACHCILGWAYGERVTKVVAFMLYNIVISDYHRSWHGL